MDCFDIYLNEEIFSYEPYEPSEPRIQLPFCCPVCSKRFKWDVQLLRHQRKTNHKNEQRQQRRYWRGRKQHKKQVFPCQYCQQVYSSSINLLNHRPWCIQDPQHGHRARQYLSSWTQRQFQCRNHQFPYYFSDLPGLMLHISQHKKRIHRTQEQHQQQIKSIKTQVTQQLMNQLNKQFIKYRRLTSDQAQRIGRAKGLSISTIRKYFRLFKQNR